MLRAIGNIWNNQKGLAMVTAFAIFILAFPFAMMIPDLVLWGTGWYKAQSIMNEIAQSLGEHGGGNDVTVQVIQERFAEAGLNPSQWDLYLTKGPLLKGEKGMVAVRSSYKFRSVEPFFEFVVPVYASATFTSEVWVRP